MRLPYERGAIFQKIRAVDTGSENSTLGGRFGVRFWGDVGSQRQKKRVPEAMFKNYTKNLGPGGPREFWNHGPGEVNDYFWGPNPRALTTFRALRL